jgi:hypothetical protein
MSGEGIAPNTNIPEYITNMMQYNYVRISKYFILYEFEDPITHKVIIHPKLLLAATMLKITIKDKFTIIAAYKEAVEGSGEELCSFDAHTAGLAIDVLVKDISKDAFKLIAKGSGFDYVQDCTEYFHLEVALKVPSGVINNA